MKLHSRWIVLVGALAVVAVPTALAAQGVYTWVDKNGVRHYSDTPHNPKASQITVNAPAPVTSPTQASAPAAATAKNPAGKVHKVPAPKAHETPAERKARCDKLRQQVEQLKSARRVEVTENGKKRFVSGEELVKFRQKMRQRMEAACKPPAQD
jgi:hypothetical protein